ncbi:MAG: histidine--tRNA ligase [Microbacteriaceae bacterium]|nr:histidine--tRNA ligase [Microbacteriaceae bacterium]
MAKDINPPRGMRDFLPAEKAKREGVLGLIRGVFSSFGFQEVESPALENLDRLTSGQGGDNEKLAYRVMKRGAELESALESKGESDSLADLGLRFDLTVPLTRFYATNRASLPTVFKAIQMGPVWRAERPQKGRYRQFVQCDIDIIGDDSVVAEVELITATLATLKALGLGNSVIRVNHRTLLTSLIGGFGVSAEGLGKAMIIIDKLDKIAADGVVTELREQFGDAVADKAAAWLASVDTSVIPAELTSLFDAVEKGKLRFDPTLVRGMGYYTGAIFEIEHPGSGLAIGGGGRYDGMVGRWLGTDVPAVGISLGFDRVVELFEEPAKSSGVVLVLEDGSVAVLTKALAFQKALIAKGMQVRLEVRPKRLNLLLDSMAANGFSQFALVDSTTTALDLKPIA